MGLESYRQKRDFRKTAEPRGKVARKAAGNGYLIQKHAARRLHYDLRLEMDGVLKSWAVTRGPSLVAGEKRLAVHVEDHPLDYGTFEGTIPKGEYGGGTVILWDRGAWTPVGDAAKGYAKGHLEFELAGEKLRGRFHLVRMARKPREKADNWLLIKAEDDFARPEGAPEITDEQPLSVKTGRSVEEVAGEAPGWSSKTGRITRKAATAPPKGAEAAGYPGFIPPALATLRPAAPKGRQWLHEIKFDGYRLQAHLLQGKVRLYTRSGLDWTDRFGARIPAALAALGAGTAILDGELVVEGAGGASDFPALQADLSEERTDRMVFYAFDLLHLDGADLRPLPQRERKAALQALLKDAAPELRYSEHFEDSGEMVLRHACRLSLEGIVSKDAGAPYRSGRGKAWIKSKCSERQEFVVAGYVPSSVAGDMIGSLLLAYFEGGQLVPAGRVGTGFSTEVARMLFRRLQPLREAAVPFARPLSADERRGLVLVRPDLVAEVEFRAWTAEGSVRHAAFRGLREDKAATEVVREAAPADPPDRPQPPVRLTHPDRIYWPEAGVTKQGLADYLAEAWPRMAFFVANRPLSLLRCPGGIEAPCFFQKHAWRGQSAAILKVNDPAASSGEPILAIDGLPGLMGLVQGGVLEIHPWGATLDDLERPDFINMDLDPGPDVDWPQVIAAALEVRARLKEAGLESFVKTSGGKGLHVVAPLKPQADWPTVKAFAKGIADAMAADSPDAFVATVSKARRKGRILVDYLRNGRGATAVAPWSTRARPGAAVSMPIGWEELTPALRADHFTVANALGRLAAPDPWDGFRRVASPLRPKKG